MVLYTRCWQSEVLGVKMDLHGQIMNLGTVEPNNYADGPVRDAYRIGHYEARHAAAELALKADAELDALRKDAARYRWLRDNTGEITTSAFQDLYFDGGVGNKEDAAKLDAAIDAARGQP